MSCSRHLRASPLLLIFTHSVVACNGAITVAITSDRPVPAAIDSICLGVADEDLAGGHFGRHYRLEGAIAALPQSLRVEPGGADAAWAWVRADRGGTVAARAATRVDFSDDVAFALDGCLRGGSDAPTVIGPPVGPPNARLAVSQGAGGPLAIAFAADGATVIRSRDGQLVGEGGPAIAAIAAVAAGDVDGDCDDDLVVAPVTGPPQLWLREGASFVPGITIGTRSATALALGDVDRDGFADLVAGAGAQLSLFRSDGSGGFTEDTGALSAEGQLVAVRAIAVGDLGDDGAADLIVAQAGAPLRGWLGDSAGGGTFSSTPGLIAPLPLDATSLELADIDGDFHPDLVVTASNAPLRVYVARDGRLEDQTFVRFPTGAPRASSIAIGGWDAGCAPDAVIATASATESRRGDPGGELVIDGGGPPASEVAMIDLDGDGDLDAVLATADGVQWLAR